MIEECVVRNLHSHRRYNSAPLKKMALNPQLLPSGTTVLMEYEVFGLHQDGALFLVDNIPGTYDKVNKERIRQASEAKTMAMNQVVEEQPHARIQRMLIPLKAAQMPVNFNLRDKQDA
ncbi:hypothetical protein HPP92_011373 [Vanilla planifolia]|uniref:Uncharacterized protein n=1 Tax=Vanilla planifolia TaxID=51239 RepID=A0A835R2P4_VANPL|nr:hypothetical protein HPP92_011667 [Vanilla planifolia]KAG0483289.1 hypothetical protein HPP92_011373 [Vanilla planifolia]